MVVDESIAAIIITIVVALFTLSIILYEQLIGRLRKKTQGRHILVRLWDAAERQKEYICQCNASGRIYLGFHWVRWVNYSIFASMAVSLVWAILSTEQDIAVTLACTITILISVSVWSYLDAYREMRKFGHSENCARRAALLSILYSGRGSTMSISRKKK